VERGIYPAVDPLASFSRILDPRVVGQEHYTVARAVKSVLKRYKDFRTSSRFWASRNFSDNKRTVARARASEKFLRQPMYVAPVHGPSKVSTVKNRGIRVRSFKEIVEGKYRRYSGQRSTIGRHDR